MTDTLAQPFAVTMDGPVWLRMEVPLEGVAPAEALAWFTQPDRLRQWWGPQEIAIDPVPGGAYVVSWPKMGWTMRGQVAVVTGTLLAYSWSWDHEPHLPARSVIIHAGDLEGGSLVTVTHGPFRQGEALRDEDADRASHLDGWSHHLPALKRVAEGRD